MRNNGYRIRLTGKVVFVYYYKKLSAEDKKIKTGWCTNKSILSKRTSVDYNTLMTNFTRKGKWLYENEDVIILKVYTDTLEKGSQSIKRKGKGGMENFLRFVNKRSNGF